MRLLLLLALLPLPALADTWTGHPRIVDGDTIKFEGTRVRLLGIDAFEKRQTCERDGQEYSCGQESIRAMRAFMGTVEVQCEGTHHDKYKRPLVHCHAGDLDLGEAMVRSGWAVSEYGREYAPQETDARADLAGAWAGTFTRPRAWRHKRPD